MCDIVKPENRWSIESIHEMYTTLSTAAPLCKVKCTSADKLRVKPPSMIANSFPQTNSSLYYSNFTTC